jgi:FecR protein
MLQRFTLSLTVRMLPLAAAVAVCLTPLHAQFGSPAAKVLVEMGQVSILKDGYQVPLFVDREPNQVNPKQVIVTGPDGYAKFQTSDGSTFEIFPNARITFRDNYPNWTDYIQVWMGRIRVQIDHHLGKNPNRVYTPTAVISVRGTIFDVEDEDQEDTTVVTVEEGVVEVQHRLVPSEIELHTNESIRVYRNAPIAKVADHSGALRAVLDRVRQGLLDLLYTHPGGVGGGQGPVAVPGGGSSGGVQGDTRGGAGGGTNGGKSGSGTPGNPPAPGNPPPPGGGG